MTSVLRSETANSWLSSDANGAGKSSLLGAIAGTVAAKGSIVLAGRRIDLLSSHQRARAGIAFVPEGRRNLFAPLTVDENLQLGLRLSPESGARRSGSGSSSSSRSSAGAADN